MKRVLTIAVGAALVLTACGDDGNGSAATVGDSVITVGDVRDVPHTVEGTMAVSDFAQYLGALIQWQIIEDAAADEYGVAPTDEEVDAELGELLETLSPGMTIEDVAEEQNISEATLRTFARATLIQERVAEELGQEATPPTDEEVAAAVSEQRADLTEVCVRHLLVDTEEEAVDARSRIEDGEDFAAVAGEMSTDPSAADNGGDLGCSEAGRYVPEFRDAAVAADIDAISDPVESQFGFHVLQVYERTDVDEADLLDEDEVRQGLIQRAGSLSLQEWLASKVTEAVVTVDERYGTWTTDPAPQVIPPPT